MRARLAVVVVCSWSGLASAQRGGDIALDGFRPPLDTNGYVTVDGAGLTPPAQVAFGLYTTWAHDLLRLDGDGADYRVRDVVSPTLVASVGVPRLPLALGVSVPFGVVSSSRADAAGGDQGVGDLGLHAKLGLGRRAALAASAWLPTATDDAWLGAGAASGQVRLVIEGRAGRLRGAINGGVRVRAGGAAAYMDVMPGPGRGIGLGTALPIGGAVAYGLAPGKLDALAEAWALIPVDDAGYAPVEALAGLKVHLAAASHLTIGGGLGLGPANGNPDARAFLAIVFEPGAPSARHTVVPAVIEPPPPVTTDDRDGDRLIDALDGCPDLAEDFDQVADADGCPDTDADADGLVDDADLCATVAEDRDGLGDDDGCPEADADGDRIADTDDRCATTREIYNGVADDDGCPDTEILTITDGGFELLRPIHFEFDSAVIKEESYPVVRAVADALRAHAQIRRMEIAGHTDRQGSASYNLRLSRARAAAVRAHLIDDGVDPDRLTSEGYGETVPIDLGTGAAADRANRRVEFVILPAR